MNRMLAISLLVLASLAGCMQPKAPEVAAPPNLGQPPAAQEPSRNPNEAALVNPGFEEWNGKSPVGWKTELPDSIEPSRTTVKSGTASLSTIPPYYYNQVSQDVFYGKPLAGKTITFYADTYAAGSEPNLIIQIGGESIYGEKHPGDKQWRRLQVVYEAPKDSDQTAFTITLGHGGSPSSPAYFDNARVEISDTPKASGTELK